MHMKNTGFYLFLFFCFMLLQGCLEVKESFNGPAPGIWRAVLQLEPDYITHNKKGAPLPEKLEMKFKDINENQLPFLFEVIYDEKGDFEVEVINGTERIKVDELRIGVDRKTARDTIEMDFSIYESTIKAVYRSGIMEGNWIVHSKKDYSIPFVAYFGKSERFTILKNEPIMDVSGKWKVTFDADKEEPYFAIGEFKQEGNHVAGTFITETGDYRYLDGTIQADMLYLSCFDGSHAFLFEAQIAENKQMKGLFRSGKHYKSYWEAVQDEDFTLRSPDSLTYIKDGYTELDFSFKNTEGALISLNDDKFHNKVKIVQILGTWCPNCRDETEFLMNYLKNNPTEEVAIIALAFEKYKEEDKALSTLKTYKEKFNIPYDLCYAGYYNKEEAAKSLPMLNAIISYPTMIILDKNNEIKRIHTGFSGPATSEFNKFSIEFKSYMQNLLKD